MVSVTGNPVSQFLFIQCQTGNGPVEFHLPERGSTGGERPSIGTVFVTRALSRPPLSASPRGTRGQTLLQIYWDRLDRMGP